MGKHKGCRQKSRHRGKTPPFSTLIITLFRSLTLVSGTGQDRYPKTLLAVVNATTAQPVILPSAVLAQEE